MAEPTTTFRIQALVKGVEGVEKLKNSVRQLSTTARPASQDVEKLRLAANLLGRHSTATTRDLQTSVSVLRDLRANVQLTSNAYKQLSADLKIAEQRLERVNRAGRKGIGTGGKAAVGAFAGAAATQILPGATTQMAALGGVIGGPVGAGIGAGIGATIDLAGQAKEAAKYAASVKRLEIALRGVTRTSLEYAKAQKVIAIVSKELNVPIGIATKQFTTLSASVIGAGGSVEEAEKVFRGVSEAIKATGGDAYDIQQAIRAMSQIFGKGKVSAEELQGQLGERLPGAVVKFADATNRTLPQLQKDLRDGTVGLNDVMKFVVKLSGDHRQAALEMAGSTEEAGQRMDVALKELQRNLGETFQPAGADIQNFITDLARMANATFETAKLMDAANLGGAFNKDRQELVNKARTWTQAIMETNKINPLNVFERNRIFEETYQELLKERLELLGKTKEEIDAIVNSQKKWNVAGGSEVKTALDGAKEAVSNYLDKITDMATQTKDLVGNMFKGMEDQLVNFVTTGIFEFKKFAQSIINEMARIAIRQAVMKPLTGWFGSLFGSADGNVFAQNGIQKFARGGVVDKPTIFPFAGGTGLMGEAGPEAILPLRRRNGKLGVEGGGGTSVVVNVDASGGTQVSGSEEQARMLGKAVAAAVRTQIANERRPGGLLYA